MKRNFTVTSVGILVILLFLSAGCKSDGGMKNPFSSLSNPFAKKPHPGIESPAEMDNIPLKEPPENYTKSTPSRQKEKEDGLLAQNGSYRAENALSSPVSNVPSVSAPNESPVQMAMNPAAYPAAATTSASSVGSYSSPASSNPLASSSPASSNPLASSSPVASPTASTVPYPSSVNNNAATDYNGTATPGFATGNSGYNPTPTVSGVFAPGSVGGN